MITLKTKTLSIAVSVALSAALFSGCSRSVIPKDSYLAISFTPTASDKADRRGNSAISIIRGGKVVSGEKIRSVKDNDDIVAEYKIRFRNGSCSIDIYDGVEWKTYVISPDPCPPGM